MKYIIVLLTLSVAVVRGDLLNDILGGVNAVIQPLDGTLVGNPQFDHAWNLFKNVFNKTYRLVEDLNRRLNFEQAISNITQHNLLADLGLSSYRLGINKYSDLSLKEISKQLMGFNGANDFTSEGSIFSPSTSQAPLPLSIDWRKKGYVTPVKDQGQCGSCYAFSSTGALEGQLKKKTGKLVSLSEQQLVDCTQSEGNQGCDGGWMNQAFKYIKKNGGIDTEVSYPYLEQVGNCSYTQDGSGGTVTGYANIPSGDEFALMKAVATVGPISVAINAGGDFAYYESGIYDPPVCGNTIYDMSHAPLLVGYGTENGQDYWLVKNSWGQSWGIDGYIKMARNKGNKCGIATKASYPLV